MLLSTVFEWLSYIESLNQNTIELGLTRIKKVALKLDLLSPKAKVIVVGGTNGKGSTVQGLETLYLAAGYKVGAFTSPYLFKINEQIRMNGQEISDAELCNAFHQVELARDNQLLTSFEFVTLAALYYFRSRPLDVWLLEIGLGGRLDAVNIIDGDLSIITSISFDHMDFLGNTLEAIAYEKAGIFRHQQKVICGERVPPQSLIKIGNQLDVKLFIKAKDYFYQEGSNEWSFHYKNIHYQHLPKNALSLENMSTVLMAITLMQESLPVTRETIVNTLTKIILRGRIEIFHHQCLEIFDVAHNEASIRLLKEKMKTLAIKGKCYAVFSMLKDKAIHDCLVMMKESIDHWFIAPLPVKRGASLSQLKIACEESQITAATFFDDIKAAYEAAKKNTGSRDAIIVFGSFHTVAAIYKA